jgi:antitoxin (DNA-binding transcriptional repressor) of toxin-antitoxin stability system
MHQVRYEDSSSQVQALLGEAMAGEEVVFTRGPKAVLKLVPVERSSTKSKDWVRDVRKLRGILKGIDTTIIREEDRSL